MCLKFGIPKTEKLTYLEVFYLDNKIDSNKEILFSNWRHWRRWVYWTRHWIG